ncbi:hypothetical protein Pure05_35900 [Paenarthrobacter ureafaciens]|nr:hypothetical protein Pure05_35900 [Paenarthrobacter ureafaciens]
MSTAWVWCTIMDWANMVSSPLWSPTTAELEDMPELPWFMPGMLPPPAEQPARTSPAATAAAEMVRNFFMGIRVLQET